MAFSKARPQTGRDRKPQLRDEIDLMEFPPNKWVQGRYIGPYVSYSQGWIRMKNPKPGGKKYIMFPKICLDYDPKTEQFDKEICPYRKGGVYMPQRYIANFLSRDLQEDRPRRQREPTRAERKRRNILGERWRCKEQGSRSWTPVRAHDMPAGLALKLQNLSELNTRRKNGKKIAYDITDPRNGMDVMVRFNPKAAGTAMWEVQRAEPTRLTKEELNYLIYPLDKLKSLVPEDKKTARAEWQRIEPLFRPEKRDNKDGGKSSRRSSSRSEGDRRRSSKRKRNSEQRDNSSTRMRSSSRRNKRRRDTDDLDDLD